MTPPRTVRPWIALALVALVLVAFVERWVGLDSQLPHQREADAVIVFTAAYHDLPEGAPATHSAYPSTFYPLLLPWVLVVLPGSNYPIAAPADAPLEMHLAAAGEPYLRARRLIALLSLLMIPGTYLLARHWLEPWWSVFAAALATTSLLALNMSQLAKPHGALVGTSTLALAAILVLIRSPSIVAYAVAGAVSGLAIGCLYTGCFVVPALVVAHWLGWRSDRVRGRWAGFALAAALCAGAFVLAYPFIVFGDPMQSTSEDTLNFGQQSISWEKWNFRGFGEMVPWMAASDPVLVALVGLGVVVLAVAVLRGRVQRAQLLRPEVLALGSFVALTVFLFGLHDPFFPRFFLPLVPVFALVGAGAVRGVCTWIPGAGTRMHGGLCAALALAVIAFPAYATAWCAILHARDDTETAAARWIEANVPPDSGPIAVDFNLSLPLLQPRASVLEIPDWSWEPWQRYLAEVMPPDAGGTRWDLRTTFERGMLADRRFDREEIRSRLERIEARWAVVALVAGDDARRDETRLAVRAMAGEPVVRILPRPDGMSEDALPTRDIDPQYLRRMLERGRKGPPIEIYRLP